MEWRAINHNGSVTDQRTIQKEDFDKWKERVKLQKADKVTQPGPIVSDYTKMISGNTANVYKKVLRGIH